MGKQSELSEFEQRIQERFGLNRVANVALAPLVT
jgi:hypothetical protein